MIFFWTFKRWVEIDLMILSTSIRIHRILLSRISIQSMRINIIGCTNTMYEIFFILSYLGINLLLAGVVGLYGSIRLLLRCPWIRGLGGPWPIYRPKFRVAGWVVVFEERWHSYCAVIPGYERLPHTAIFYESY